MTSDAADRDWLDGAMRRVFADDDRVARTVARLDAADRDWPDGAGPPRRRSTACRPGGGMTSTPLAAVLERVADALEECADSLDALDRADRADRDALQVLTRAAVDIARHLDRTDDQESENHHNG